MTKKKTILSISTKTGDKGLSGLANGQRLSKSELIFEVLGSLDELNSHLGLSIAHLDENFTEHKHFLLEIQDVLFVIGAEVAQSPKVSLQQDQLDALEKKSETLQKELADNWTTKFIYPGGTKAAAMLDVTRTVARRVERVLVLFSVSQTLSPLILQYINRLSDFLFVFRCFVNEKEGYQEVQFTSGERYIDRFKAKIA